MSIKCSMPQLLLEQAAQTQIDIDRDRHQASNAGLLGHAAGDGER